MHKKTLKTSCLTNYLFLVFKASILPYPNLYGDSRSQEISEMAKTCVCLFFVDLVGLDLLSCIISFVLFGVVLHAVWSMKST